jgi:UrcA family protein
MSMETTMFHVTHRSNIRLCSTLLVALAYGAAATAQAASAARTINDIPSVRVAYGDLNLATNQGARTLDARIRSAAREVCFGYELNIRDLQAVSNEKKCESVAIAHAVQQVHSVELDVARDTPGRASN